MREAGKSLATLARWLAHSSPTVTLGYYAHFTPEAGSKGRTVIDGMLGRQGDRRASRNSPDSPKADRGRSPGAGVSGVDRGL
ncbi:integrase [Streptomyces mirabilis]|uniref:integrase n=1 Tax=Streptomyces mirabilis TaxID=68239 RepID=UPI0036B7B0B8